MYTIDIFTENGHADQHREYLRNINKQKINDQNNTKKIKNIMACNSWP